MEIILGKSAGFCYGVKRAVEGALKETSVDGNIYCLGEIVHNKSVVNDFEKRGVIFIENITDAKEKCIIRAHGVNKNVYEIAKQKNIKLKDFTCPSVLKIQKIAHDYTLNGYYIILFGNKNHPEVIGITSHCDNNFSTIMNKEDVINAINSFKSSNKKKLLIISQTTYSSMNFDEFVDIIKKQIKTNIEIKKTICPATELRQNETAEIAEKCDVMIIIGDKKSSNSNKLYEIAQKNCKNVQFIQKVDELVEIKQKENLKIGVMAGASTPKEDIDKVIQRLKKENICKT